MERKTLTLPPLRGICEDCQRGARGRSLETADGGVVFGLWCPHHQAVAVVRTLANGSPTPWRTMEPVAEAELEPLMRRRALAAEMMKPRAGGVN